MTAKRRIKLLAVGLYKSGTGFTRVLDSLFSHLSSDVEIHWLGIAYKGPGIFRNGYQLYPNNLRGGDMYGSIEATRLAEHLHIDYLLLLNDVWMIHNYSHTLPGKRWKILAYIPLDGEITSPDQLKTLLFLDRIILYNNSAKKQFSKALRELRQLEKIYHTPSLNAIFHGLDHNRFHAKGRNGSNHSAAKKKVFGHIPEWEKTIFILNANRLAERKDHFTTLQAFSLASSMTDCPARLCLHLPGTHPTKLKEIDKQILELGLEDLVIINPLGDKYVSSDALADLYRACEIGLNTSLGEGWGLVSFEHAACGGAQIVPGHENQREIWGDAALYSEAGEPAFIAGNPFKMYRSDPESIAVHLVALLEYPDLLHSRRKKAEVHVNDTGFSWETIAQQWSQLLQEK